MMTSSTTRQPPPIRQSEAAAPAPALAVSVLIPTKDRPTDLGWAVHSLLAQTVLPSELIIVDQSADRRAQQEVFRVWAAAAPEARRISLRYFHAPWITGAAPARNFAMDRARGAIWLFLDDDVCLESDFIAELLRVYRDDVAALGVSGVVSNYPMPSWRFRLWRRVFERGPFRDERQPIYWHAKRLLGAGPIPVRRFGSGLMSFRAEAIRRHRFDGTLRGVPRGEDVDFCERLGPRARLLITPRARLAHKCGDVARVPSAWLAAEMRAARYLYRRNWRRRRGAGCALLWLLAGYALLGFWESVRAGSWAGCRALITGLREQPPEPIHGDVRGRTAPRMEATS